VRGLDTRFPYERTRVGGVVARAGFGHGAGCWVWCWVLGMVLGAGYGAFGGMCVWRSSGLP